MTIYVFTGPTLSADEGSRELEAVYLPPAAQGDVYRIGLRRPYAIGIIDGYFDRVPAVWHKEILWAMAEGIHVYGAASMGALRAAELAMFGMVGIGEVFEAFRDGVLEDDDEVAVAHAPAAQGFQPASEAMVNIRCTLRAAEDSGVIRADTRQRLGSVAKALFFPDRSYARLFADAAEQGLAPRELDALREWLPRGRVDQKRTDALEMLRVVRRQRLESQEPKRVSFVLEHTKFWDRVIQSAGMAAGDAGEPSGAVSSGAVLDELRLDARALALTRREALLHHLIVTEAQRRGHIVTAEAEQEAVRVFRAEHGLSADEEFDTWLATSHLTAARLAALMREATLVRMALPRLREESAARLLDQLRLSDRYRPLLARARDKQRTLDKAERAGDRRAEPSDDFLMAWFLENLGPVDETTVEGQASVLEFAHQHLREFLALVAREYAYRDLKGRGRPVP
ncbi:MAG: TfuA-like protein [Acidobacteriota bacterium]